MSIDVVIPSKTRRRRHDGATTLTEMDVAQICEQQWLGHRIFEQRQKRWYVVSATGIWQCDETEDTARDAQIICRDSADKTFQSAKKVKAVVELARRAPGISVTSDIFDRHAYLLGTPKGPVCLKTGKLLAPDPALYITRSTSVAPDPSCATPIWDSFIRQVTGNDAGVARLIQQWFGYSLTGDTREQKLCFVYGRGRNGKGVTIRVLDGILGSYAHCARSETFANGINGHPTEMAAMRGKRMVYCTETERGKKWNESRIKEITGGDKIRARFMGKDEFEYVPELKLIISGNYEPQIESADEAMRNRFFIIPFDQVFSGENADQHLDAKLRQEWPGIWRWAIEGGLDWQRDGLVIPPKVQAATAAYFDRQDVFAQWLAQETVAGGRLRRHKHPAFR